MNILSVESELCHADGRTDVTNLTVAFHEFPTAPKNSLGYTYQLNTKAIEWHYNVIKT